MYFHTGKPCLRHESIKGRELKKENCEEFVNETSKHYDLTIKCLCGRKDCFRELCNHLATCFKQRLRWGEICYNRLIRRRQFNISTSANDGAVPYVRNIQMKYLKCLKRISIKTTTYRCRSTKALTGKKLDSQETYLI